MFTPQQLREIREALGYTTTQFGALLGVAQNTVARWESGDRFPRRRSWEKLNEFARQAAKKGLSLTA